ncbi:MAG: T9SS type A sorting domain-containing protein [Bacteroidales bacterium]
MTSVLFKLFDLTGKLVLQESLSAASENVLNPGIQSGLYFYQFTSTNGQLLKAGKVIKK